MNEEDDTHSLNSPTKKIKWVDLSDIKAVKKLVQNCNQIRSTCEMDHVLRNIKKSLINEDIDEALRIIENELK